jgi:translation initiation factor 2B subunit (eIF-2B alpha/beta/delta family)
MLGVPVTFVTDASMAEFAVKADWILVGADSLAVDGAVANKMGTNLLSIVADRYDIPFYVASELLKLQLLTRLGMPIVLEQRPVSEVVGPDDFDHEVNVTVVNQFFDLTPPQRIRAIITEQGVYSPGQIDQAWQKLQQKFEG